MKKILLALSLALTAQAVPAAMVNAPLEPGPVPQRQINALITCMAANSCGQKAFSQTVDKGLVVYSVAAASTNGYTVECTYLARDSRVVDFGVTMTNAQGAIYLHDANIDGKVDGIAGPLAAGSIADTQPVLQTDPYYDKYQGLYLGTMELIQKHIIQHTDDSSASLAA